MPSLEQIVFTKVRDHLLAQNKQSESGGLCLYRGPGGLKCAVGCLIPDEKYHPDMDDGQIPLEDNWRAMEVLADEAPTWLPWLKARGPSRSDWHRSSTWRRCGAVSTTWSSWWTPKSDAATP